MVTKGKKIIFSIRRQALLILIIFLIVFQPLAIYAEENINLKNEAINPGSFYYSFKRLWEKGMEKLQFSQQSRLNYLDSLLETKLSELNYVVENKLLSEVQGSSERFAYYAGILTEELIKGNKDTVKVVKEFEQFSKFLEKLRDNYPANTSFWMLVQHDINTLTILSERLK